MEKGISKLASAVKWIKICSDIFDDEKIMLLMNHINSEKRDSLNGHSPYELSLLLLDQKLHKALGLTAVAPDDVMLSPNLLK